jgi:glycosyltransferase involved in cell wall biosynthesis
MPLRVGLNLLHLVPGETGGSEIYARRLIPALVEYDSGIAFVAFTGREATPSLRAEGWATAVEVVRVPVDSRSRARRVLAEQVLLPRQAHRARLDLLHNLFTTAPALPGVPQVTTILDVIYKRYPEAHAGLMAQGMRVLVPLAAKRSRRVLTLSHSAKEDIVRFLRVPRDRVDITYLGPGMEGDVEPVSEREVRDSFELGNGPIVLAVSAKRPHKNLERLVDAFARVSVRPAPTLVVIGYSTPFEGDLKRRGAVRVRLEGWVDDAMLEGLYRAATCLVFPSLAEGFGLPVLEAMSLGLPVACSNATSLPEVAGDAAVYFDPTEATSIARAIEKLLLDKHLRERLRAAGLDQARKFSWERTAEGTLASYERALGSAAFSIAPSN